MNSDSPIGDGEVSAEQISEALASCTRAERKSAVSLLQALQNKLGYLPSLAIKAIAGELGFSPAQVYGVATFYNQFRFIPPGKHPIKVCKGTACHIRGAGITLDHWERRLGISSGEVTRDREFSLEEVACVGCCAMAPVTVIGEEVHGKIATSRIDGILLGIKMEKEKSGAKGEDDGSEA